MHVAEVACSGGRKRGQPVARGTNYYSPKPASSIAWMALLGPLFIAHGNRSSRAGPCVAMSVSALRPAASAVSTKLGTTWQLLCRASDLLPHRLNQRNAATSPGPIHPQPKYTIVCIGTRAWYHPTRNAVLPCPCVIPHARIPGKKVWDKRPPPSLSPCGGRSLSSTQRRPQLLCPTPPCSPMTR